MPSSHPPPCTLQEGPAARLAPLASHPPLSVHETRSRAPEFYGFVAWTTTAFCSVVYVLWALLPDELIVYTGIDWYPNREWAIFIPAWSIIVILLTYFTYWALAISDTPSFHDLSTITDGLHSYHFPSDSKSHPCSLSGPKEPYLAAASPSSIPRLCDIPIAFVNKVLYDDLPPKPSGDYCG